MVLSLGAASFVVKNFALNTDITQLISSNLPWRQLEIAYVKAFPGQDTAITVVVDGPTPEFAEDAAEKLTQHLNQERNIIRGARQLSGGPFFQRNGLLYLAPAELKESLDQLSKSRALLEPLAADPSLRGVMSAISLTLRGVQARRISLETLAPQFNSFSATIENALTGHLAYFSWRELLSGGTSSQRETRQFLEVFPVLDFN